MAFIRLWVIIRDHLMPKASMRDPRWRLLARFRLYCNACCIASIAIGSLILCGWIFGMEPVNSLLPPQGINASLALMCLGGSLWLLLPDPPRKIHRRLGLFFAAVVASIGAVALMERVLGPGAGFASYASDRMPPATDITFLSLGLALLLLGGESGEKQRLIQVLSLWGVFAGIMSVGGFINDATATYGVFSYSQGDMYLAVLLLLVSTAVLFARPTLGIAGDLTGTFVGSAMARALLPAVIVVPIFASWIRMQAHRAGLLGTGLGLTFNLAVNVSSLSFLVLLSARQLNKADKSLEHVQKAKEEFYHASLKDELTGLYNRRGFLLLAEEQIKLACSGRRELLVVFADVDGLKGINDGHGHSEGDRALRKTAEVLLSIFRDTDLIARLGGDEFAILALDCCPAGLARINAHFEKMLRIVNKMDNAWKLSISVGALHVDSEHQITIDELLNKADGLMYEKKRERQRGFGPHIQQEAASGASSVWRNRVD